MDASMARRRSRAYAGLARAFSRAEPGLEQEYTRLFVGPGSPVAHPHESVYREGRTMGRATLDVRRQLVEEGLAPEGRTLPDHICIELAFMAHLADREALAREAGDVDTGQAYVERQGAFLRDHLLAWLPQFCRRLLAGRPHAHYANLARDVESFVIGDVSRVEAWLGGASTAAAGPVARSEWWGVTVGQGCTLCEICTQVCRPGALRRAHADQRGEVSLYFETALCDGCAACQHWCPEKAVQVARVPDGERPASGELARSAMLACPRCGRFHAPAALVTRVQAQMKPGDGALSERLALCRGCRVQDVPLRRRSTSSSR